MAQHASQERTDRIRPQSAWPGSYMPKPRKLWNFVANAAALKPDMGVSIPGPRRLIIYLNLQNAQESWTRYSPYSLCSEIAPLFRTSKLPQTTAAGPNQKKGYFLCIIKVYIYIYIYIMYVCVYIYICIFKWFYLHLWALLGPPPEACKADSGHHAKELQPRLVHFAIG